MLSDLFINKSGDIVLTTEEDKNEFRLSFFKTNTKSFKVSFYVEGSKKYKYNENTLIVRFDWNRKKSKTKPLLVSEESFIIQQIFFRLKTSLTDIKYRENIGSKLELIIHKNINDNKTIEKLRDYLLEALSDLISERNNIIITPLAKLTERGYVQYMDITIQVDEFNKVNYEMEW